jgi:hypothetical protein
MILENGGRITIKKTEDSVSVSKAKKDVLSLQDLPKNKSISMLGLGLGITRIGSIVLNSIIRTGLVMYTKLQDIALTHPAQGSAEFNGTSDYIQLNEPFSYTNHTIAAWVYADNTGSKSIIDLRDSDNDGIRIQIAGGLLFYQLNASDRTTAAPSSKEWKYVVGTYDGTTQKLYIDGSVITSTNPASQTISVTTNARIGADSYQLSNYFNGNLANVAIWNRALTSDEINSVMWKTYEQVSTAEKSGLQAWYKLSADEVLSGDDTATLTTYANANGLTFEAPACVQTALNGLPDITDARLYSANYSIRVNADGGTVESLSCVETELNAIL